ncbi:MAG: aldo/keto reductase [Verrucomicrobia bacterium]|nr:aldo/keto reductase [Verrucomicrobiota bacterium]MBI3867464.1 aldo/keto reductase [Verrucomicrobiota bacterium]
MKYRPLGKTGWKTSILGLGASPLGGAFGSVDEKAAIQTVQAAIDLGINLIDVAPFYGSTRAETIVGRALKGIGREKFFIATKVGRYGSAPRDFDFSAARVVASVDESLKRLRLSHIDLIQAHDVEFAPLDQLLEETLPALERLKTTGKVRHIGITAFPLEILKLVSTKARLDTVQSYCRYCLSDITLVRLVSYLKGKKVGIINASPFAMGLLTDKGPPAWHPAPANYRDVCARAVEHCKKRKKDLAKLALQFAVSHLEIATTLVGTSSAKKLKSAAKWIEEPIDEGLLAEVQGVLKPILNQSWLGGLENNL